MIWTTLERDAAPKKKGGDPLLQMAEMISFVLESDRRWERRGDGGLVLVLAPVQQQSRDAKSNFRRLSRSGRLHIQ